jgi:hypothetical protein
LTIEVVCHAIPKWVRAEHKQAIDAAWQTDKLPILVIHEKGEDASTDLVVLRLSDFVDWFGSVKPLKNNDDATVVFGPKEIP